MKTARGKLEETYLDGSARIICPPELIPAPGQYLLAHADGSDAPLPVSVFSSIPAPGGFRSAPHLPSSWKPGKSIILRGPIGHGFSLPVPSRKIALVAFDDSPARLQGLIPLALKQNAEIVLVGSFDSMDLPEVVEIQPLKAMTEVLQWADYAALDSSRENLAKLRKLLEGSKQLTAKLEAQILVRAPMPCGALADCGVCSLALDRDWKMICKDGPVFPLRELL